MGNSRQLQPQTAPRIAHVEVGGSLLGGSLHKLGVYLRHCNADLFQHEVLFYQRPPGSELALNGRWPSLELGLSVPPQSSVDRGSVRRWVRTFASARPRLSLWLTAVGGALELLTSLPVAVRLAWHFRRRQYALIHCNNSFTYQIPTVLGAWLARKPLICHFRTIRQSPLTVWQRWLSRIPLCIVAIHQAVADGLKRQGIRTPVVVCEGPFEQPNIVAENAAALRRELLGDGTVLVGTVTRLEDGKGIEDLLAAVRLLRARWPKVRYVIVGGGSKAETLQRLAAEWGLRGQVRFVGFRSNVFDHLACLDICVCPSHAEGVPASVINPMLVGLPVVATRVGMVAQLIRDGENGLLVNSSDPGDLAQAIEMLLADPARQRAIGAQAASSVQALCDPEAQARELDALFAQVLSRAAPKGRTTGGGKHTAMKGPHEPRQEQAGMRQVDTDAGQDSTGELSRVQAAQATIRKFYEQSYSSDRRRDELCSSRFTKMWYQAVFEHCLPRLPLRGSRVLEVGCGFGLLGTHLSQLDAEYIGVDIALSAVAQFPRLRGTRCYPAVADARLLPFRSASFDILFCLEVVEHVPDPNPLLDECFRVVRPGGYLIFSCPNYCNLYIVPKLLAELGAPFFHRYMRRQVIDRITTAFSLRRLLARRGVVLLQRGIRLHPPLFDQLDYRLRPSNPLRRINVWISAAEELWGDRPPLNYLGLHTLCVVRHGNDSTGLSEWKPVRRNSADGLREMPIGEDRNND